MEMNLPAKAAIVILNYNTQHQLEQFLPNIIETAKKSKLPVYVADNFSTDNSISFLEINYPEVHYIALDKNYGFAEGYNQALQQVAAEYFILMNSDIKADVQSFYKIIEFMDQNQEVAACQPKILSHSKPEYFEYAGGAGGFIDWLGYPFCKGRIFDITEKDHGQYNQTGSVFWASGAAFFVRSKLFNEFGGFDGSYFAHAEEIDLCWRLKRAGYHIYTYPEVSVYHVGGGTLNYNSPFKTYLNFRNTLSTIFKNESSSLVFLKVLMRLVLDGAAAGLFLIQGNFKGILAIIHAHWHFFVHLPHHYRTRKNTSENIEKNRIGPSTVGEGLFDKSIVWHFYFLRKKYFSQLI